MEYSNKISKYLETTFETDYLMIFVGLFFCIVSSFILMYVYKNKANSLSSKTQISMIIPLLSGITFLVILVVKSSLALSLGLVGALSVIRFRTPVKEPEDLAYLFFAIALGIGYGALQIISTSIIFLVLIFIIWFFLSSIKKEDEKNFNLLIEINQNENQEYFDKILVLLKTHCQDAEIVKIEKQENTMLIFYKVYFEKTEKIKNLTESLEVKFKGIKFSLYENQNIG